MRQIQKGSVDRSVDLYIIDSTDGTPEVGVLWNTAGIDLKYRRDLSAVVSVTEATLAALTTAHTDGGFLEIGNGVYRFDLPDAAWATGADHVTIFGTVTGMIVLPVTVQLVEYNPEAALATPTNITAATGIVLSGVTHTGAVIPTVSVVTGLTASNLDATISSRATQTSVDAVDNFIDTEIADIQSRLPAALVGGRMDASVGAIANNAITAASTAADVLAEVKAEVVAALATDTYAEPGQGTPSDTLSLAAKINHMFKAYRNKKTQTSSTWALFNSAGTVVDQKATLSDDGTTFTNATIVSGP